MDTQPFLGLRTAVYYVEDLGQATAWYREVFKTDPYFNEPFYVGFNIGGYELALHPATDKGKPGTGGTAIYWGVLDAQAAFDRVLGLGAKEHEAVQDVGGGIKVASVVDPFGNILGIIENPHFKLEGP